ncbi:DNA-binding protein [Sorangium sp. So ce1078]|uniref:DNA-binding protein n=1 Tax=Sorangium sp. So ce1078 TaxID=3133329 RepID=UPI003F5E41CA
MPSKPKEQTEFALPKGIGKPATRALALVGVSRLDQVTRFSEAQLLALHGVGPKAVGVLKAALEAQGKSLAKGG